MQRIKEFWQNMPQWFKFILFFMLGMVLGSALV